MADSKDTEGGAGGGDEDNGSLLAHKDITPATAKGRSLGVLERRRIQKKLRQHGDDLPADAQVESCENQGLMAKDDVNGDHLVTDAPPDTKISEDPGTAVGGSDATKFRTTQGEGGSGSGSGSGCGSGNADVIDNGDGNERGSGSGSGSGSGNPDGNVSGNDEARGNGSGDGSGKGSVCVNPSRAGSDEEEREPMGSGSGHGSGCASPETKGAQDGTPENCYAERGGLQQAAPLDETGDGERRLNSLAPRDRPDTENAKVAEGLPSDERQLWTKSEDEQLRRLLHRSGADKMYSTERYMPDGDVDWSSISKQLNLELKRVFKHERLTKKQVKDRWEQHLRPGLLKSKALTKETRQKIIEFLEARVSLNTHEVKGRECVQWMKLATELWEDGFRCSASTVKNIWNSNRQKAGRKGKIETSDWEQWPREQYMGPGGATATTPRDRCHPEAYWPDSRPPGAASRGHHPESMGAPWPFHPSGPSAFNLEAYWANHPDARPGGRIQKRHIGDVNEGAKNYPPHKSQEYDHPYDSQPPFTQWHSQYVGQEVMGPGSSSQLRSYPPSPGSPPRAMARSAAPQGIMNCSSIMGSYQQAAASARQQAQPPQRQQHRPNAGPSHRIPHHEAPHFAPRLQAYPFEGPLNPGHPAYTDGGARGGSGQAGRLPTSNYYSWHGARGDPAGEQDEYKLWHAAQFQGMRPYYSARFPQGTLPADPNAPPAERWAGQPCGPRSAGFRHASTGSTGHSSRWPPDYH